MKGKASDVFVPDVEDEDEDDAAEGDTEKSEGEGADALLGNAYDAFQDGDRAGFVRSMRAALRSLKG